jgi:glycosyltransferase involved in cell wall biosynthesis
MALISALICTRDRPSALLCAVKSLLASEGIDLELIVVDQSHGTDTEIALAALTDHRLRYLRSRARGKGAALNEGLTIASGDFVACTDDDCEAPPCWVVNMARILEEQPTAAVVFCNVVAGPYDIRAGYVPTYEVRRNRLLRSIGACRDGLGFGAGMIFRRQVVNQLGGFDETFGPGARFASGDEHDLCHRVLLRGWHVYETADVSILHHGFLTFAQGRMHTRRDWMSTGATGAKLLRSGRFEAASLPLWLFGVYALWPPIADLLRFRRPRQVARVVGFVNGFVAGLLTPVDRRTLLYQPQVMRR